MIIFAIFFVLRLFASFKIPFWSKKSSEKIENLTKIRRLSMVSVITRSYTDNHREQTLWFSMIFAILHGETQRTTELHREFLNK